MLFHRRMQLSRDWAPPQARLATETGVRRRAYSASRQWWKSNRVEQRQRCRSDDRVGGRQQYQTGQRISTRSCRFADSSWIPDDDVRIRAWLYAGHVRSASANQSLWGKAEQSCATRPGCAGMSITMIRPAVWMTRASSGSMDVMELHEQRTARRSAPAFSTSKNAGEVRSGRLF